MAHGWYARTSMVNDEDHVYWYVTQVVFVELKGLSQISAVNGESECRRESLASYETLRTGCFFNSVLGSGCRPAFAFRRMS